MRMIILPHLMRMIILPHLMRDDHPSSFDEDDHPSSFDEDEWVDDRSVFAHLEWMIILALFSSLIFDSAKTAVLDIAHGEKEMDFDGTEVNETGKGYGWVGMDRDRLKWKRTRVEEEELARASEGKAKDTIGKERKEKNERMRRGERSDDRMEAEGKEINVCRWIGLGDDEEEKNGGGRGRGEPPSSTMEMICYDYYFGWQRTQRAAGVLIKVIVNLTANLGKVIIGTHILKCFFRC
ncbi:hypothetical protein GPALN_013054 [Globodera pallida]|nr:hypothetical protein GPALN_013054 [Globodera pallida]